MEVLRRNAKLLAAFFSPMRKADRVSARAVSAARNQHEPASAADTHHLVAESRSYTTPCAT